MIKNITKKYVLAKECNTCSNFFTIALGLMFKKKMIPTVLKLNKEQKANIHTFFVKHYLDVIFLNEQCEVVDIVECLQPKSFYTPKQKAMFVVELPEGTIAKSKTEVGDFINIS